MLTRKLARSPRLTVLLATLLLTAAALLVLPVNAWSARHDLPVSNPLIYKASGVYHLDADVKYTLTSPLKEALTNGVGLMFDMQIQVLEHNDWWPDSKVAAITQRNRLEFHALSRQYIVENLNSNVLETFPDLTSALRYLGRVRDLPVLDASLLEQGEDYMLRVRVEFARDELPLPLRARGYFSDKWKLRSDWHSWPLR